MKLKNFKTTIFYSLVYFPSLIAWKIFNIQYSDYVFIGFWYYLSVLLFVIGFNDTNGFVKFFKQHGKEKTKVLIGTYILFTLISAFIGFYFSSLLAGIGLWRWSSNFEKWSRCNA